MGQKEPTPRPKGMKKPKPPPAPPRPPGARSHYNPAPDPPRERPKPPAKMPPLDKPFNDGGPAYPLPIAIGPDGTIRGDRGQGMTLFQHYAGLSMQAIIIGACTNPDFPEEHAHPAAIAEAALGNALAMIEAEAKLREVTDG